jgi:hypothetical protein
MSEGQRITSGLHELLRYSMPGYVFLFLFLLPILQEIPRLAKVIGDASLGAFFAIGGPIVGLLLFHIYEFVYREVVWRWNGCARFLGFDYIPRLKMLLEEFDIYTVKAVWDAVFFKYLDDDLKERILFLNSRAHSWAVIGFGTFLLISVWYPLVSFLVPVHSLWILISFYASKTVTAVLLGISIPAYVFAMKHAGQLEFQEYLKLDDHVRMEAAIRKQAS